jgi:hypothetical protein
MIAGSFVPSALGISTHKIRARRVDRPKGNYPAWRPRCNAAVDVSGLDLRDDVGLKIR